MLQSMTGHGAAETPLGSGRVSVEVRAVNHRYLDVRVRVSTELLDYAGMIEELVRKSLVRGRIEVLVRVHGEAFAPPELDLTRARKAYADLCKLRDELRPDEPVPLALLSCVPDLFTSRRSEDAEAARQAIERACELACKNAWTMRDKEGEALAADLSANLAALTASLALVEARIPAAISSYHEKLRQRVTRLLAEVEAKVDSGRLEHEVALFADRADVAEETARLASHLAQTRELVSGGGEGAGRRLDFLLQEMTREVNTLGSKSSDVEIARHVIEMKAAVSRMREQAQNVL